MRDPLAPEWSEAKAARAEGTVFETRNTWTNLAYLIAGSWCATQGPTGVAMAVAFTVLGLGSGWYHATADMAGQQLDRIGMHLCFAAMVVCGLAPFHPATPYAMLAIGAGFGWAFVVREYVSLDACMALYLVLALASGLLRGNVTEVAYSFTAFGLAYTCWHLDHRTERPFGLWGHAVWHVLTALAMALLFAAVNG
jgi:hypothetical protein